MRRVFCWLMAGVVALAGCAAVDQDGSPGSTGPSVRSPLPGGDGDSREQRMAREIFDRVNAERAARGFGRVAWNEDLAAVARQWSQKMASTGRFEHQDVGALLRRDRLQGFVGLGENIFRATGPVPAGAIHAGWMRSDGHRANVVNPGWDRVGIAVFCTEDGAVWATQEFGRTAGADRPSVSEEIPPAQPVVRPEQTGPQCRS